MKPIFSYRYQGFVFETYNQKPIHFPLREINQTHSCFQQNIHDSDNGKALPQADALNFNENDLEYKIPAIRTADCLPIWIISSSKHYLIHAGWRGLADGIIQKCIGDQHIEFALIGPSICQSCFEVKDDFRQYFSRTELFQNSDTKLTFNLAQQAKLDIGSANVQISNECTHENNQLHSFRLDGTQQRNWSIVRRAS